MFRRIRRIATASLVAATVTVSGLAISTPNAGAAPITQGGCVRADASGCTAYFFFVNLFTPAGYVKVNPTTWLKFIAINNTPYWEVSVLPPNSNVFTFIGYSMNGRFIPIDPRSAVALGTNPAAAIQQAGFVLAQGAPNLFRGL